MPLNTTSLIQPVDQKIIATCKRTFQYILDTMENDQTLSIIGAWNKFSVKDCVTHDAY